MNLSFSIVVRFKSKQEKKIPFRVESVKINDFQNFFPHLSLFLSSFDSSLKVAEFYLKSFVKFLKRKKKVISCLRVNL